MNLHDIPKDHLILMLKSSVWYSADRPEFDRQGYSMEIDEETALRDINYRDVPLYPTAEEAIFAFWNKHFKNG